LLRGPGLLRRGLVLLRPKRRREEQQNPESEAERTSLV